MKKTLGILFGLALASMARGQAIADYAQLISNFAIRLDSGSGVSSGGVTGGTCTNQLVSAIDTSGVPTCASVASAMIPAGTVTLSNLAVAAANSKLLGSGAAGSGAAYSELTLGTNLSMSGTTLNAAGAGVTLQGSSPGTADVGNMNVSGIGIHDRDALTTTTTEALSLRNNTASTGGATRQVSPSLNFYGHAWNTATDDTDISRLWVDVGSAAATTMTWKWDTNIAGGGYVNAMSLTNAGVLTTVSTINSGGALSLSGTTQITFTSRSVLKSPADGVFTLFNNGSTDFTRLNFGGTTSSFPALSKESASGLSVKLADNSAYADITTNAQNLITANAAQIQHGSSMELLTIAAAATTDTSANLLPANAHIDGVVVRVTTVIPTAVTFQVGDATTAGRFCGTSGQFGAVAVAANTTGVCNSHLDPAVVQAAGPNQVAAAKIRITPSATPGAATGVVRITVFWTVFVPPTS